MAARGAGSAPATAAPRGGGRAFGPGPRRRVGVAVAVVALAAALAGVLLGAGRGSSAPAPARYGGLPSWLPKATIPVNRTLRASPAHPALAIQGNTVAVALAQGRVLATAVGPDVPEEGRFPVPATSPCTFVVTFASASGSIPLSSAAFTAVDELHHVHHLRVTAMGGGALPGRIPPGRTVSLTLYGVLPTGDGGLEWAPAGGRPVVAWDYDVEID